MHDPVLIERVAKRLRAGEPILSVVVGAGRSGRSAARLLAARGARVRVVDDRVEALQDLGPGVAGEPLSGASLVGADLVVLSPGVPRSREVLAPAIAEGRLVGEIELASWLVAAPLVGITGTNGKSTTTALVGHMLEQAGIRAFVGGNLGEPLSELAFFGEPVEVAVLELSSFQLESVETARFWAGAWLNLEPDHLDRYPSLAAYAAAKERLFERLSPSGVAIANARDPVVQAAARRVRSASVRWFAEGAPLPAEVEGGLGTGVVAGVASRGEERFRVDGPGLLGPHNHENAAAAIEVARALGASPEAVQAGLSSFRGLPHRLSLVLEAAGVRFYDDSKATNVASAATAVRAMSTETILLAGGRDKGGSWDPLVEAARGRVVRVLAIGEAAAIVEQAFAGVVPVEVAFTLERAVARAKALARPGQAVLLAPACASLDQFTSYAHRGAEFARWARAGESPGEGPEAGR